MAPKVTLVNYNYEALKTRKTSLSGAGLTSLHWRPLTLERCVAHIEGKKEVSSIGWQKSVK